MKRMHSLPRNMQLLKVLTFQNHPKNTNYFGSASSLLLQKSSLKILIFEVFLPVNKPLVATFSKTRVATSRKNIDEQGMHVSKLWEKHKLLWWHSFGFILKLASKMLIFKAFYFLKNHWWLIAVKRVQCVLDKPGTLFSLIYFSHFNNFKNVHTQIPTHSTPSPKHTYNTFPY